jgi:surface carbohydrate biosynthesis protein
MNIYISIEIKRRELSSRMLLALESAIRGHDVYIGDLEPYLKRNLLKPGIVHFKSLPPIKRRVNELSKLKKKNFICTSQDEESGHINDNPKEYVKSRYGKKTIQLIDSIFTWGKFDFNNLKKTYPKFKSKFVNTGNPRIDFWRKDFSNFYKKRKEKFI